MVLGRSKADRIGRRLEAQELYANGTHSSSLIHGYDVNMYFTLAKNVKHKDNVFDYAYGTRCGIYSLVFL